MGRIACSVSLAFIFLAGGSSAADAPLPLDSTHAAQLRRLEPLTPEKVDVFVESGQLTHEQGEYVKRSIGSHGELLIPENAITHTVPGPVSGLVAGHAVHAPSAARDPYAALNYSLSAADRAKLESLILAYRHGDHADIGRQLRLFRPAVNQLIAQAYSEPIDLPIKVKLWQEVAGPANPEAAFGLFDTHRALYLLARPILVPYYKDVGGILVRRRLITSADPARTEDYISSRDLRNLIEDTEGLIARCPGVNSALFLTGVYDQRYNEGEAPLRDKSRDRDRLLEACGGNVKDFDEDKAYTWSSTLSVRDRAIIADRLIPWLARDDSDRRKIITRALAVCLPPDHPDWKARYSEWDQWWSSRKGELMAQK